MYKAIIVDDEEMARMLLKGMIEAYCPSIEVIDVCHDLPGGVKSIRRLKPDLVFLDIEMPGHSGLELLEFFDDDEVDFSIIFTTAYHQYAIQAFKLSAVDYLLKPIDVDDLEQAVNRFQKGKDKKNYKLLRENLNARSKKMAISTLDSILFVSLDDILFFKAEGAYTHVYLNNAESTLTSKNLKYYEGVFEHDDRFYRCHKSYIINMSHVSEYVKTEGGYLRIQQYQISISQDKLAYVIAKIST